MSQISTEKCVGIALLTAIVMSTVGIFMGINKMDIAFKKDLVQKGLAKYTIDEKTGETTFTYWTNQTFNTK